MPPKGPRNQDSTVFLFDLKTAPLSTALDTLSSLILYTRLSTKNPKIPDKLYLVNSHETSNECQTAGLYHINPYADLAVLLSEIASMAEQAPSEASSCWLDALDLAKEDLKPHALLAGIVTAQIVFISDMESFGPLHDEFYLKDVIRDLRELDIFVYFVGPSVEPPKALMGQADVAEWMAGLSLEKKELKSVEKLVKKTPHSVVCKYEYGVHLVNGFKYFRATQPWYATLDFGTKLKVPTSSTRITKRGPPFKLKSTLSRKKTCWAYADSQDTTVSPDVIVSGVLFHGKFLKMEYKDRFNPNAKKDLRFLMFTPSETVPEYLMRAEGSYFVRSDPREQNHTLFNTIVEEMAAQNLYAIARKTYNAYCKPKFIVLIPKIDYTAKGFISCEIPYADDLIRTYKEESVQVAPVVEIDAKMANFLDSIDISGDACKIHVPLAPKMMINPNSLRVINKVKQKLIEEFLVEKKHAPNEDEQIFEEFKKEWPVRALKTGKKEKVENDSFDDVDDFNFE